MSVGAGNLRPSPSCAQFGEPPVASGLMARLIVGSFRTGTVVLCMYLSTSDSIVDSDDAQRSAMGISRSRTIWEMIGDFSTGGTKDWCMSLTSGTVAPRPCDTRGQ